MDRSGTMSSLDVDELIVGFPPKMVSSLDTEMMHPKDGPGFTHGVLGNPVANHEWHNSLELLEPMWVSHLDHTVDGCEIHQLVDIFSHDNPIQ